MLKKQPVTKQTPSIAEEQLAGLRDLMPQVFTEGKIDFEKLHATLGDFGNENPERYSFSWAGKRDAIRILQTPSRATLIPARKESINFDKTQNIFIEGDNLEVLKLLYKPYFGQVKMIYIDPPYNTGNDFVYPDNFADPLDTYLKLTGQKDGNGNLLTSNAETNGRYHSKWLSMMYPRLFLARQLLREDGVIFVSIDDNEVANLKLLMDEIFGEENFIGEFIWHSRQNVDSRSLTGASIDHEYVLCYSKSLEARIQGKQINKDKYSNPDNDSRGAWMSSPMDGVATRDRRPNLHYAIVNAATGLSYEPSPDTGWRFQRSTVEQLIVENRILWPKNPNSKPRFKRYLNELSSEFTGFSSVLDVDYTAKATQELRQIMGMETLKFPKPLSLLKALIQQGLNGAEEPIVLDFFAGSGTTAQSVLELNEEDGGNRKFILVQLPEPTENKEFPTIAEIGKERIRRVIGKMEKEREGQLKLDKLEDLGFKVFKLHESNYKQWDSEKNKDPESYAKQMKMLLDPLVEGWKEEDVLYEVALKEGYGLNVAVEETDAKGVQKVSDSDKGQSFYICLADKVKMKDVKPLKLKKDDIFICRDIALDDETAANLSLQCRLKTI